MSGFLHCYRAQGIVGIAVVTKDNDGSPVTPDAGPLVELYRVDPTTGIPAKDLNINAFTGELTMSLVAGSSFLYSAALDLSEALFEQYEVVVTYSYGGAADTAVQHLRLFINDSAQIITNSSVTSVASVGTTFKAPTPTIP